jgi:hypothetical protein
VGARLRLTSALKSVFGGAALTIWAAPTGAACCRLVFVLAFVVELLFSGFMRSRGKRFGLCQAPQTCAQTPSFFCCLTLHLFTLDCPMPVSQSRCIARRRRRSLKRPILRRRHLQVSLPLHCSISFSCSYLLNSKLGRSLMRVAPYSLSTIPLRLPQTLCPAQNRRDPAKYLVCFFVLFTLPQCWIEIHEARRVLYRNTKTLEVSDVRPKTVPSARAPPPAPPDSGVVPMPPPPSRKSVFASSSGSKAHPSLGLPQDEYDAPPPPVRPPAF